MPANSDPLACAWWYRISRREDGLTPQCRFEIEENSSRPVMFDRYTEAARQLVLGLPRAWAFSKQLIDSAPRFFLKQPPPAVNLTCCSPFSRPELLSAFPSGWATHRYILRSRIHRVSSDRGKGGPDYLPGPALMDPGESRCARLLPGWLWFRSRQTQLPGQLVFGR